MYNYKVKYLRNYDGDTITFLIDLGFKVFKKEDIRLARVDTKEIRSGTVESKQLALEARDIVHDLLNQAKKITISVKGRGKYGRYIAEVDVDGINLSNYLLEKGLAEEYHGK